ncbi:MAG: O-sialoglycoprotein endopeptidase [Firmicutes bacterium]|nr:O-sialoglycoprotein endopeptidase [Bacillota bacterium]
MFAEKEETAVKGLGVDTSCYTSSVAVLDQDGSVIDRRKLLEVRPGQRGLRQGEAVFQHVGNLPELLEEVVPLDEVGVVAVSDKPRSLPDSYMPVFKVGESLATSLALALNVPCYFTSHQAGHIWAGLYGLKRAWFGKFLVLHISGGTTDLLKVSMPKQPSTDKGDMEIEQIGGTLDINAGQLIDRLGVKMGLRFPAGPRLEELAQAGRSANVPPAKLPVSVKGASLNLSGPEAAAGRMWEKGIDEKALAQGIEMCLAESLAKLVYHGANHTNIGRILVVGGVASNKFIGEFLKASLQNIEIVFAPPHLSTDNAVGTAAFGLWKRGYFCY